MGPVPLTFSPFLTHLEKKIPPTFTWDKRDGGEQKHVFIGGSAAQFFFPKV
jgi:hypothetical protein